MSERIHCECCGDEVNSLHCKGIELITGRDLYNALNDGVGGVGEMHIDIYVPNWNELADRLNRIVKEK